MKARTKQRVRKRSADIIPPNPILRQDADAIRALGRGSFDNFVEIGRRLERDRKILKKQGAWLAWLKAEFSWSRRTADRFIAIFEAETTGHLRNLRTAAAALPLTAIYALAKASPEVVADVERRLAGGERVKAREIVALASQQETFTSLRTVDFSQSDDGPIAPRTFARHDDETPPRQVDLRATEIQRWLRDLAAFADDLRYRPSPDEILAVLSAEQRVEVIETARAIAEYFSALFRGTAGAKLTVIAASSPSDEDVR